eukprot:9079284-Pyramimonas_sp.AAC.1
MGREGGAKSVSWEAPCVGEAPVHPSVRWVCVAVMPPGSFAGQPRKPGGSRRVSTQVPCSVAVCWPSAVAKSSH